MKKEKKCKINKNKGEFKIVTIGSKQSKPQKVCKEKCLKKGTVACNYNGKTRECTLIYSGYKGMKDVSGNQSCGEVVDDEPDTPVPTSAPTTTVPSTTAPTTTTAAPTTSVTTLAPTAAPTTTVPSTTAPTTTTAAPTTSVTTLVPTAAPTTSVTTLAPTAAAVIGLPASAVESTSEPTAKPTPAPVVCELEVKLGYPFDDPDEALYYGYHASMLSVVKDGDDWYECSYYYPDDLPDWCTYGNTNPEGDSTFLSNWDDNVYYDDVETIDEELVHIFDAAGETFIFTVEHYYFEKDYYPNDNDFNDHMNTPTLTIENLNGDSSWSNDGWTKDVEKDVSTHIKVNNKWVENPDYNGSFAVTVSCNSDCSCDATYELI